MGRQKAKRLNDRRTRRHLSVTEAADLIQMARYLATSNFKEVVFKKVSAVAEEVLEIWTTSPVVLRVDSDFARALLESDADVTIGDEWMSRLPFDSFACAFPAPLSLHDGTDLCHYQGFAVAGVITRPQSDARPNQYGLGTTWTTYHPLARGDGARFLWLYRVDGDPTPRGQTITVMVRGELGETSTLAELIESRRSSMANMPGIDAATYLGSEMDTLVPLSIQLLLYLTAQDPDLTWPAPDSIARPQQLADASVGHVGWRVGAALRQFRTQPVTGSGASVGGGWRLPPHIRKAHWTRVRVATRDANGAIIGSRTGVQDVDWHYELRWIPPTPVNTDLGTPSPTARQVDTT